MLGAPPARSVPGPGHSSKDRSLKVWEADGQVYVHSFAGDDWRDCRAYLDLEDKWQERPPGRATVPVAGEAAAPAAPSRRVHDLLRTAAPVDLVPDAVGYLQHFNAHTQLAASVAVKPLN